MYEFFSKYSDILKILKDIKDPGIKKNLTDTLEYMRSKMFKTTEHLDSILEKNIEDVTPQDIIDIAHKLQDPELDRSWFHGFIVHTRHISIFAGSVKGSPCVDLTLDGFKKTIKIMKPGFSSHEADDIHAFNYKDVGIFNKHERLNIIKTVLNLYRFFKLNDILPDDVYSYPKTWNSNHDNFWEGLARWCAECNKIEVIKEVNWDYDSISEEAQNLLKIAIASEKFNLKLSA